MNAADVPVLGWVLHSEARSRVFNSLLVCGPLLVGLIAAIGRNPLTIAVAAL